MSLKSSIITEDDKLIDLSNTEEFPAPDLLPLQDIFELKNLDDTYRKDNFSSYNFHGFNVPRVSNILSFCGDKDSLIRWAANVEPKEYFKIKNRALRVGTAAHEAIEMYLRGNCDSKQCKEF